MPKEYSLAIEVVLKPKSSTSAISILVFIVIPRDGNVEIGIFLVFKYCHYAVWAVRVFEVNVYPFNTSQVFSINSFADTGGLK